MQQKEHNWAGNYTYGAARIHRPETVEQLQDTVRRSDAIRALGSRHSFNAIADSAGDLVALTALNRVISLDRTRNTVTIEGGMRYGEVGRYLHEQGYALHNLASLPHISVAGACATATHGSGERHGNLATSVRAMELVSASGDLVAVSRETHPDQFDGMPVSLGALGVIASLTLDVVPTFDVQQDVYEDLPLNQLEANFDEIQASAYSVSLFTDWRDDTFKQLWLKRRVGEGRALGSPDSLFGATRARSDLHPLPGVSAESCTAQMGIAGPWCDRLPHFRMEFTPSGGEELQSEYFVVRDRAVDAIGAVMRLGERIAPHLLVSEVRTIAADSLWMSPCYQRDSVAFHFTWKPDWPSVSALLPRLEEVLAPYDARPHWGKLFTMPAERVQSLFARLPDFRRLLAESDPSGKFTNGFVHHYVGIRR